jgi:hypothetical protein
VYQTAEQRQMRFLSEDLVGDSRHSAVDWLVASNNLAKHPHTPDDVKTQLTECCQEFVGNGEKEKKVYEQAFSDISQTSQQRG